MAGEKTSLFGSGKVVIALLLAVNVFLLYIHLTKFSASARQNSLSAPFEGLAMLTDEEVEEVKKELRIDLNTADHRDLQRLHRVGWSTADNIIKYREAHGPFEFVEDIQRVPRVGWATYQNNKDKLQALREGTRKDFASAMVNINEASKEELVERLQLGPTVADRIIEHRTAAGSFKDLEELQNISGVGFDVYDRIKDYARTE